MTSPIDWTRRPRLRLGLTLLLLAVLAALFPLPHFGGWYTTSRGLDWGSFQLYAELTHWSLQRFGQLPFFNPYLCGGTVHLANPQSSVLSLWTLLDLLVGPQPGVRLRVVATLFIAMSGTYVWARYRAIPPLAATGAALAFGLSGFFAARIAWGHQGHFAFAYLPLVMLAYEHARRQLWAAVGLGALIALMLYDGGAYPVPMTIEVLALRAVVDMLRAPRRAHRIALIGLVAGLVALGLSAPKLLPMLDYQLTYPRKLVRRDHMLLTQVFEMFLSGDTRKKAAGYVFNRFEYYNYLGPIVIGAVVWGLWRARRMPYREIYILVGLVTLFMIGDHGPLSPAVLQRELPILSSMRVEARYTVVLGLLFALVFGYALAALSRWLAVPWPRARWLVPALLIAGFVVDAFVTNQGHWPNNAYVNPALPRVEQPLVWLDGGDVHQYERMLRNQGSAGCYEGFHIPAARGLRRDSSELAWLQDPGAGQVQLRFWSPDQLELQASLQRAGRVIVNVNHIEGWRLGEPAGASLGTEQGLIAVALPAGEQNVLLQYRPPHLELGVGMLVATLAGIALALGWQRRRAVRMAARGRDGV